MTHCVVSCVGFCNQQVQDITALAGHVGEAMGSRYQLNRQGRCPVPFAISVYLALAMYALITLSNNSTDLVPCLACRSKCAHQLANEWYAQMHAGNSMCVH